MSYSKCKIQLSDITYGPATDDVDELTALTFAYDLMQKGYRKTSNNYCTISRIDREDWLDVLAKDRRCSRADFYNIDGTGVGDQHRDYYIRLFSKDRLTVHPTISRLVKGY